MKRKYVYLLAGIFFVAIGLRSVNLVRWFEGDEAVTLRSACQPFQQIIPTLIKHDAYPPLTPVLLHFWMKISQNEIFIRSYFILFGLFLLVLIGLIADELFDKNRRITLSAVFLGSISPLLISLSQFVRGYIDSAFWVVLSSYFLLLIVRNKGSKIVWAGYLLSVIFGIYTFYFSIITVFCQNIYFLIIKFRERRLVGKWILAQLAVMVSFLPWLPNLISQFANKHSNMYLHWEGVGFKFLGLDLGGYARNIASLFGLDYFFMVFPGGIAKYFGLLWLFVLAFTSFVLISAFLYLSIKWIRKGCGDKSGIIWFLFIIGLLPLIISWIISKDLKTSINARYLAAPHAVFIILICAFLYNLTLKFRRLGIFILALYICLLIFRIPMAVTPIYETRKAVNYLKNNLQQGDCVVMVIDYLPAEADLPVPNFNIASQIIEVDPSTSRYRLLPEANLREACLKLRVFKRIWFVSCYGNVEVFGGNDVARDFLRRCGRKESASREFHNYKIYLWE